MTLTRHCLSYLCAAHVALSVAAMPLHAQEAEAPSRPGFLLAMGLLEQRDVTINRDGAPYARLSLPESEDVRAVEREFDDTPEDVIAAWDFVTTDGRFVESLTLTLARIDITEPEARRFALANLLVLRSFPQLARQFQDARLLTFGPVAHESGLDMVQIVGAFSAPESERDIVFRHIGILQPESEEVPIAIINIDTSALPVRGGSDLIDTYAGRALDTLRLATGPPREAAPDAEAEPEPAENAD